MMKEGLGLVILWACLQNPSYAAEAILETKVERLAFEPTMVNIPAGRFTMGCLPERDLIQGMDKCPSHELPAHQVEVKNFQISQ